MTIRNELKNLIERSGYTSSETNSIDKITDDLAELLIKTIEGGETSYDGSKGFHVSLWDSTSHGGIMFGLGFLDRNYIFGRHSIEYRITEQGVDLGRRLLEERNSKENQQGAA